MKVLHSGSCFRLLSLLLLITISSPSFGQIIRILDEKKNGLEAVWVYQQEKDLSFFSDVNGYIKINGVNKSDSLYFEHLGFKTIKTEFNDIFNNDLTLIMDPVSEILEEVLVLGRTDRSTRDIISEASILSKADFRLINPQTTVDAMSKSGELFVQKSQMGGGSPVIRGYEANRVLLVVDGIRLNNAIYRNGHLHNSLSIDPSSLDNIEIIFGPSSLSYGSDALGGVIHFRSRRSKFNFSANKNISNEIDYKLRYSSANKEKKAYLSLNSGWNNLAIFSGVSYSKYDDLRSGNRRPGSYPDFGKRTSYQAETETGDIIVENNNPNVQVGTGYDQLNLFQKMRIKLSESIELSSNVQWSSSSDVPRYDFLSESSEDQFNYAQWYYGPQNRFLASVRTDISGNNVFFDNLIAIAASQRIDEDRYSRKFNNEWLESTTEDLWVHSFTLDFTKRMKSRHKLIYGLDVQENRLKSKGLAENIKNGAINTDIFSRYPNAKAKQANFGAYANYILDFRKYQMHSGLRLSRNILNIAYSEPSPVTWPDHFYTGIENDNTALAYSIGLKYEPSENQVYKLNLSSAFRTPNIDDLAKIRVKNGEILVPNPDLKAEVSYNGDLTGNIDFVLLGMDHKLSLALFSSNLRNGIVRQNFKLPNGDEKYFDGSDSLLVVANQNVDNLLIYGSHFGLSGKFSEGLSYGSKINLTKGYIINKEENDPAPHIPPLFGQVYLKYKHKKWEIKLSSLFNGAKNIDMYGGSVDNPEYATVDGTYAWNIFSIESSYAFRKELSISFGIENILDKHYRTFASGVSAPGFNAIVSIQGKI